jgi:hypothetical protein
VKQHLIPKSLEPIAHSYLPLSRCNTHLLSTKPIKKTTVYEEKNVVKFYTYRPHFFLLNFRCRNGISYSCIRKTCTVFAVFSFSSFFRGCGSVMDSDPFGSVNFWPGRKIFPSDFLDILLLPCTRYCFFLVCWLLLCLGR